jgi:hypothetical protein
LTAVNDERKCTPTTKKKIAYFYTSVLVQKLVISRLFLAAVKLQNPKSFKKYFLFENLLSPGMKNG